MKESDIIYKGPKGDILNMPLSSITYLDWSTLVEIMQDKLGNDSFDRKFKQEPTTLREDFALKTALIEMFGDESLYNTWENTPELLG